MKQEKTPKTLDERTVNFTKDQLIPIGRVPSVNLYDLHETAAYKLPDSDDYMLIECEPADPMRRCSVCKKMGGVRRNGYTQFPRLVHDVNVGLTQVDLLVKVPKYSCSSCGATFNHEFDSIVPNRQFTKRLFQQVKVDSFYDTFSDVAAKFGIANTTVADIFDIYTEELAEKHKQKPVGRWLAIDEKHVDHQMRGIFVDGETGNLLEITENNSPETIKKTIMSLNGYENITHVTMDMANGYKAVVEEVFGIDAKIIVDKWHVLHDLATKISKSRTAIIEYLNIKISKIDDHAERERFKAIKKLATDNGYLFKFSFENVMAKDTLRQIMAEVCAAFPEFNHLRLIKQGFEDIYKLKTRAEAERAFDAWCKLIPPSGKKQAEAWEHEYGVPTELYEEFRPLKNTMAGRWRVEIFNYFDKDGHITNAIAEGTNSFIERVVINGYSFKRMRARALYWYDADPRLRYVIETRKQLDTSKTHFVTSGTTFEYIDVYGIYEAEEQDSRTKRDALNVLSFLPPERRTELLSEEG